MKNCRAYEFWGLSAYYYTLKGTLKMDDYSFIKLKERATSFCGRPWQSTMKDHAIGRYGNVNHNILR